MKITINGSYGSISDLVWDDVPSFAVLTGPNGAGKSQLLEIIASSFGVLRRDRSPIPNLQATAVIEGRSFSRQDVFYAESNWDPVGGGTVRAEEIEQAMRELLMPPGLPPGNPPWALEKLAEREGLSIEGVKALSPEALEEILTPSILWGGQKSLAFLFLAYRILENNALKNGKSETEVIKSLGEKPWVLLNEILAAAALPYRAEEPIMPKVFSIVKPLSYTLTLRDTDRNCLVPFEKLSAGEKVIMSTSLWHFNAQEVGRNYKLLLLDEPDAHLHPSMARRFVDVIQKVFVEERDVQVIMSTHSASTVALVPEASLFEMRRHQTPRIEPATKSKVMAGLTDGLVVVHDGMSIVLCEGINDHPFYSVVWEMLSGPLSTAGQPTLSRTPAIVFMYGNGITTVRSIVPQLRKSGLSHFYGLIDLDEGNKPGDGIKVIGRRALENYLFDPINIWCLLHNDQLHPDVPGVEIPRGQRAIIKNLPEEKLQKIADVILDRVRGFWTGLTDDELATDTVNFLCQKTVRYPRWLLHGKKEPLKAAFVAAFPRLKKSSEKYDELITSFATLGMMPSELAQLMAELQGGVVS